jgi:hypothetical protein
VHARWCGPRHWPPTGQQFAEPHRDSTVCRCTGRCSLTSTRRCPPTASSPRALTPTCSSPWRAARSGGATRSSVCPAASCARCYGRRVEHWVRRRVSSGGGRDPLAFVEALPGALPQPEQLRPCPCFTAAWWATLPTTRCAMWSRGWPRAARGMSWDAGHPAHAVGRGAGVRQPRRHAAGGRQRRSPQEGAWDAATARLTSWCLPWRRPWRRCPRIPGRRRRQRPRGAGAQQPVAGRVRGRGGAHQGLRAGRGRACRSCPRSA